MASERQKIVETVDEAPPNVFKPLAEVLGKIDALQKTDGTAIIDPREDAEYLNVRTEDLAAYLSKPDIYQPAIDRNGKPARTMRPLPGLATIMCSKEVYAELRRREQLELDRRDATIASRAVKRPDAKDDPGHGFGSPDIKINRGALTQTGDAR